MTRCILTLVFLVTVTLQEFQASCFVAPARRASSAWTGMSNTLSSAKGLNAVLLKDKHASASEYKQTFSPFPELDKEVDYKIPTSVIVAAPIITAALVATPLPAEAATAGPIPQAMWAYAHYLTILLTFGTLVAERFTIKPGMTLEEEKKLSGIDLAYGVSAVLVAVTGYFRATEYAKGFDFYSHEPLFWLKLALLSVVGGLSLFPTILLVKRTRPDAQWSPMSEKLAKRMTTIVNAEISGILFIPLVATLMARGVLYVDGFPWQAGAALVVLSLGGSGYIYAKQALTWKEDDVKIKTVEAEKVTQ